jgi:hypothetical protein
MSLKKRLCEYLVLRTRNQLRRLRSELRAPQGAEHGHPVRSAIHKPQIGRLVVGWVTTSEYLLLYVFEIFVFGQVCRDFLAEVGERVRR